MSTSKGSVPSVIYKEGETTLHVPDFDGPKMIPAFFNPKGRFVRDVSLACYNAFAEKGGQGMTFADGLTGVGARGIRVANELGPAISTIFLNDVNGTALELARASAVENKVAEKCIFSKLEVCAFFDSRAERFDIVDIDPFGTPSAFIECGIRATQDGGMLSVTATDSAVLCGVYPKVAERKYLGLPLRTDYAHEVGMRLIYGLLARMAMRLETGIEPLFCHHDMHYFRVYCRIRVGNKHSVENQLKIGYVLHCFACGERKIISSEDFLRNPRAGEDNAARIRLCVACRHYMAVGGPLWIGNLESKKFVEDCAKVSTIQLFQIEESSEIPLYYDLTDITSQINTRTPKLREVQDRLEGMGYVTSRTRLNPNALRSVAPNQIVRKVVGELAR